MAIIRESEVIPLGRQLFLSKKDGLKMEDLIIEGDDHYRIFEKGDDIVIKNDDCCRSIKITIKTKD
jgi:nitrous oxidase accessory protein NosD